jgi:hypothetical protein
VGCRKRAAAASVSQAATQLGLMQPRGGSSRPGSSPCCLSISRQQPCSPCCPFLLCKACHRSGTPAAAPLCAWHAAAAACGPRRGHPQQPPCLQQPPVELACSSSLTRHSSLHCRGRPGWSLLLLLLPSQLATLQPHQQHTRVLLPHCCQQQLAHPVSCC